MFRCDNCGSGYSIQAAASWDSCPRCLARERINVPLSFELGWRGGDRVAEAAAIQPDALAAPGVGNAHSAPLK